MAFTMPSACTTALDGTWSQLLRFGTPGVLDVLEGRELCPEDSGPICSTRPEPARSRGWPALALLALGLAAARRRR